jgi:hypothetical protein
MSRDLSAAFDQAMTARSKYLYGQPVHRHIDSIGGSDPIGWLRDTLNDSIQKHSFRSAGTNESVDVWLDFVDAKDVNACVFRHEKMHCIAVHRLTASGMLQMFGEILTRSAVFPETGGLERIGPATATSPIHCPPSGRVGPLVSVVEAGIAAALPADPQRFQLATFLQRLSLDLIYFHELSHLLLGHVGDAEVRFGPCGLFEVPNNLAAAASVDREFVADFSAGLALADCLAKHRFTAAGKVGTVEDSEDQRARDLKLAELLMFSVGVTFSMFESQLVRQGMRGAKGYPLSETRWFSVLRGFERRLVTLRHPISNDLFIQLLGKVFSSLHQAMDESGYNDPLFHEIFFDKDRRNQAIDAMVELESNIQATIDLTKAHAIFGDVLRKPDIEKKQSD